MSGDRDVVVSIAASTAKAQASFAQVAEAMARLLDAFAPFASRLRLADQRHRSRLVTRRKQRRSW